MVRLTSSSRKYSTGSRTETVRFPRSPFEGHVKQEDLPDRAEKIKHYLCRVFNSDQKREFRWVQISNLERVNSIFSEMDDFKELFGLSKFTFIRELGVYGFEGMVEKKSGSSATDKRLARVLRCQWSGICGCTCCYHWTSRWIVLRDSFVAVCRNQKEIRLVLLFDRHTQFNWSDEMVEINNISR